jgi:YfiH family protein
VVKVSAESQRRAEPGWKYQRSNGIEFLQADNLRAIDWLVHGFTTRIGGASLLRSNRVLNLGYTDWDTRETVARNRHSVLKALQTDEMTLVTLRQIHSDVAHVIVREPSTAHTPLAGDAALTKHAGLLLSVQTADCVPILLADTGRRVAAAVHAGWRGTLARIVAKTMGRMQLDFGTRPQDVVAALGPSIGPCCYEVGAEVAQAFSSQFASAAEWFDEPFAGLSSGEEPNPLPWLTMMPPGHEPPPERAKLDLRAANRWQLVDAGVPERSIAVSTLCTACQVDLLFSYRREGPATGRLMGLVGIRGLRAAGTARIRLRKRQRQRR